MAGVMGCTTSSFAPNLDVFSLLDPGLTLAQSGRKAIGYFRRSSIVTSGFT
jgi:hypothetical protein